MYKQGQFDEEYEALLRSTSISSSRLSRRSGQSVVPQKRGASESVTRTPPPPRLPSISAHLFLPSTPAPAKFLRDPPLVEIAFRRITVQVTVDFGVLFDEDEILEDDQILLANGISSRKPELTENAFRNREILQSSGWIGEGETKIARYVSGFFAACLSVC